MRADRARGVSGPWCYSNPDYRGIRFGDASGNASCCNIASPVPACPYQDIRVHTQPEQPL